jgi:hypothetical protein
MRLFKVFKDLKINQKNKQNVQKGNAVIKYCYNQKKYQPN